MAGAMDKDIILGIIVPEKILSSPKIIYGLGTDIEVIVAHLLYEMPSIVHFNNG